MKRNVQLLALTGCVAASLAVAWWTTSGGTRAEIGATPAVEERSSPADLEAGLVLDAREPVEASDSGTRVGGDRRVAAEIPGSPRLVSGTVHDGGGSPVSGAHVVVTEFPVVGRSVGRGEVLASGWSDAEGRFEIRATVPPFQLFARATKDGFLESKPKDFMRGAEGLQLVLQGSGVVSGRILLDPWVTTDRITLEIAASSEERRASDSGLSFATNRPLAGFPAGKDAGNLFKIDEEGRFAIGGFATATVAVTVRPEDDPVQVFEIRDVAVQRAGSASDPRIDPIDLRGKFERVAVDVLDDVGRKCDGARVAMREPGRPNVDRSRFTRDGRSEFFVWSGPHDIEVSLEGFRTVRLSSVYGDQVVGLRRGIQVEITLRGSPARPPPPDLLAVAFLKGSHARPVLDGIGTFQDSLRTTFVVGSPGPHEIGWYLERGSIQAYLETGSTVTVDVRDQDAVQQFVLDLPASAEAAWTDRMRALEREGAEESRQRELERVFQAAPDGRGNVSEPK